MTFARGLSHEVAAEGIRSHSVLLEPWACPLVRQPSLAARGRTVR